MGDQNRKAVIFDADGTLLDSMGLWVGIGERYLNMLGIQPEEHLSEKLFCMSMEEAADYMKKQYGLTSSREEIVGQALEIIRQAYRREILLKAGVGEFLQRLQEENVPMVIATSSNHEVIEAACIRLGIRHYFQKIFTCSEVGAGKSKPDIYYEGAKFLGYLPGDIWVFEDALHAAKTAKNAGFHVVGVYDETSKKDWQELKKTADISVFDMTELL